MKQQEKRLYLIKYLSEETSKYKNIDIPNTEEGQKKLLRSLFNVRLPLPVDKEFLKIQDEYLRN